MSRPSAAEARASEVLASFGPAEIPVPVEKIATFLGAQLTYDAFDAQVSGMLIRDEGRTIIGVNSSHAPVRQRFTVAHEIGHLIMHDGQPVFVDRLVRVNRRDGTSDKQEREANAFAAELLMPREFVLARTEELLLGRPQITPELLSEELAKAFDVSASAMGYRLVNLDVLDLWSDE